jgi:trans-aconitate 2-methyltransferase
VALRGMAAALAPGGRAQLRMVTRGAATSLEEAAEATRRQPPWAPHFEGFEDPYLRLTADEYAALAARTGLDVLGVHTANKAWDFRSDAAFFGFCSAGFGAWTRRLPEAEHAAFVRDVLRAYRAATNAGPADVNTFRFVQTDFMLAKSVR